MLFSWDSVKSETNLRKHGVRFEVAKLVFDDPLHITRQDRIEGGELRWQTIGMAEMCIRDSTPPAKVAAKGSNGDPLTSRPPKGFIQSKRVVRSNP